MPGTGRVEKTVFISYRRASSSVWALAMAKELTHHGFDVFFDFNSIASGDFEQVILGNIKARAHFLILLTPSALERIDEPRDWLRREIETALEHRRNIVPLMLEGFDFATPSIRQRLIGSLAPLSNYSGLTVPVEYFDEAMRRLRTKHLNVAVEAVLHPVSALAAEAAAEQRVAVEAAPEVEREQLTAEQWFERGYEETGLKDRIDYYTRAIRLNPDYAAAYLHRGLARFEGGNVDAALRDYTEAVRLDPGLGDAYYGRGIVYAEKGDVKAALRDFNEAIRLGPDPFYYNNRGVTHADSGNLDAALRDYNAAIRLDPENQDALVNRAVVKELQSDYKGALADFRNYLKLGGGQRHGDQGCVEKWMARLQRKLRAQPACHGDATQRGTSARKPKRTARE